MIADDEERRISLPRNLDQSIRGMAVLDRDFGAGADDASLPGVLAFVILLSFASVTLLRRRKPAFA